MNGPLTGFLFIYPLYEFAFNLLIVFYRIFGENLGVAIIMFTLLLRAVTLPFTMKQMKSTEKTKEFQDKYKAIQDRYKKKGKKLSPELSEKQNKELAQLQSEYLPSQLGGCLPMLLNIVFFFQVYYVIRNLLPHTEAVPFGAAAFNAVHYSFIPAFPEGVNLGMSFLGLNLGQSANAIGLTNFPAVVPYIILAILVGISQYISTKAMTALTPKKPDTKKDGQDLDMGSAMQQASQNMLYVLPFMTAFFSLNFPAGLSIYWTVSSGFVIIQQVLIHKDKIIEKIKSGTAALRNRNK
jgi:YidC/Oxa1 family membrane protein insertase